MRPERDSTNGKDRTTTSGTGRPKALGALFLAGRRSDGLGEADARRASFRFAPASGYDSCGGRHIYVVPALGGAAFGRSVRKVRTTPALEATS